MLCSTHDEIIDSGVIMKTHSTIISIFPVVLAILFTFGEFYLSTPIKKTFIVATVKRLSNGIGGLFWFIR